MRIIVQKFGGTSVRDRENRQQVVEKIAAAVKGGYSPVVVVSAIGRAGEPYATDSLLKYAAEQVGGEISARDMDMLMSCGEMISAVIMAALLQNSGYAAKAITGWQAGIITDESFGNANLSRCNTQRLCSLLSEGVIPVVTGFQGITEEGDVTTLGRGGSDTTAAILGSALQAELVEIYTDVDGIMTADPSVIPAARIIDNISYTDMFQMADSGAKVIHPRAVEIAMAGNIPIVVRNTLNDVPGTRISATGLRYAENQKLILAVTCDNNKVQINIAAGRSDTTEKVLSALAWADISIDLINIFPEKIVFTIEKKKLNTARELLAEKGVAYQIREECSKVSVIGSGMHGVPGVTARIIRTLNEQEIDVLQTADSHMTISCLVDAADALRAARALHEEFIG